MKAIGMKKIISLCQRRMKVILLFLGLFIHIAFSAQKVNELNMPFVKYKIPEAPKAYWITHPDINIKDYNVAFFRRNFILSEKPDSFIIHISADNRYHLYVNGKYVCMGPALSDLMHWKYETVDISPFLMKGKNEIAAMVINWGIDRAKAQNSYGTALFVCGHTLKESKVNTTDSTWKTFVNTAFRPNPVNWMNNQDVTGGFYAGGPCDSIYGRLYPWGWEQINFDDSFWKKSKWIGSVSVDQGENIANWMFTPRSVALLDQSIERLSNIVRSTGLIITKNPFNGKDSLMIPAGSKVSILIDQSYESIGYPQLFLSKGKNSKIRMVYAETLYKNKNTKGNRNDIAGKDIIGIKDVIIPDGSMHRHYSPTWLRAFRFIQLDIETKDEPLIINDLYNLFTSYPTQMNASFQSDNPLFSQLIDAGYRTIHICSQENFMSDAYYEQMQYIGDTRIQALSELYLTGDDALMRNALVQFDNSRLPEGLTLACYPNDIKIVIPTYSLIWIDMIYDYMMTRGDKEFINRFTLGIQNVLSWYHNYIKENGMLGKLPWWNFVDWYKDIPSGVPTGATNGYSAVIALHYAYALQHAAKIFQYLGMNEDAQNFQKQADLICISVYNNCYDPVSGLIAETPGKNKFSQHTNIMAVLTNTYAQLEYKQIMEKVIKDKTLSQTSLYYSFYLFEAMKKAGIGNKFSEQLGSWQMMMSKGLSTFAEVADNPRSDCHPWSTSPCYEIFNIICGVSPVEPGFKEVRIEPEFGTLNFVNATIPVSNGKIILQIKKKGETGITGTVQLPLEMKGKFIWNNIEIPLKGGQEEINIK